MYPVLCSLWLEPSWETVSSFDKQKLSIIITHTADNQPLQKTYNLLWTALKSEVMSCRDVGQTNVSRRYYDTEEGVQGGWTRRG